MKRIVSLLLFLNTEHWLLSTAAAKDFGVHGHSFKIEEPDLLKEMESKLKRLEIEGKLAEINEGFLKRTEKFLSHPKPVEGITKAVEVRELFYDPSITVPYDLKDHEGRVFHKAGTRINPLEFQNLPAPLVFIDGEDKAQVHWVEKVYLQTSLETSLKTNQHPKIILTSGSPFELMKEWAHKDYPAIYFDQGGTLTSKLGIRHVPAVVVQDGFKLKISEIVVEEDKP